MQVSSKASASSDSTSLPRVKATESEVESQTFNSNNVVIKSDLAHSNKVLSVSQIKRLRRLMVRAPAKGLTPIRSYRLKNEALLNKAREDINKRVLGHISGRLNGMFLSDALSSAITGDEFLLRLELDLHLHPVDERSFTTGGTLLTHAVSRGHFSIVQMLLRDFHANPNVPTILGRSYPLHLAVSSSFRQIAALLLTYGADPHARDAFGSTPLHLACNSSLVKLLRKYDVDVLSKNKAGLTPFRYYLKYTDPEGEASDVGIELAQMEKERRECMRVRRKKNMLAENSVESSY